MGPGYTWGRDWKEVKGNKIMIILKLLIQLGILSLTIVFSVITMIYGWGLEPKSWLIIIGVGFFGMIMLTIGNVLLDLIND